MNANDLLIEFLDGSVLKRIQTKVDKRLAAGCCLQCDCKELHSRGLCLKCYNRFIYTMRGLGSARNKLQFERELVNEGLLLRAWSGAMKQAKDVFDRVKKRIAQ
jgi:hypothetical protein